MQTRSRFFLSAVLPLAFFFLTLSATQQEAANPGERIERTRATLDQWVEARRTISKERKDWTLGRELLQERIQVLERELANLRKSISESEKGIAEADLKRAELLSQSERLKQASAGLAGTVTELEARTRKLLARLPDLLRERLKPFSQGLPTEPTSTKLSLSQRYQNVVGILNEVTKFNREITVTSEVRTLGDGTSAEVTVLYLGLGQAYYVNGSGTAAGYGTAGESGWVWTPANAAAADIARAIAIQKGEEPAAFVRLPTRVQ